MIPSPIVTAAVSVVVPVLDEEAAIDRLLGRLRHAGDAEIVVVDGGSRDRTVERAEKHEGVRVIRGERGRARQMNLGAREASGDVLLFLHADTTLPEGAVDRVLGAVRRRGADFGCFTVKIDSEDLRLRIASRMISARSRLIPSSTGDQAQFFRRDFFFSLGGYPEVPLFEDMMIVGLAARRGKYVCVDGPVRTSARRWHTHGISRTMITMLALRTLYHLGVDPQTLAKFYATHPR